jgi:predicted nucleotidyltransferase
MFRSDMQVALLGLVILQPDRPWTLDELTDELSAPTSSVLRELRRLVDAGVVLRDAAQRPHLYRAATQSPAYEPLRQLIELTVGVPALLREELRHVDGVEAAAIHGSWAAGTVRPDSDLDVFVVTSGDRRAAQAAVRRVGRRVAREADASVVTLADFAELKHGRNPFVAKILHGPRIDVVGDLDAIESVA